MAAAALNSPCPSEAWTHFTDRLDSVGADGFVLFNFDLPLAEVRRQASGAGHVFSHACPSALAARCEDNHELRRHDPFARYAVASERTLIIDTANPAELAAGPEETAVVTWLRELGLGHGMLFPIHNRAERSLSCLGLRLAFDPSKDPSQAVRSAASIRSMVTFFNEGMLLKQRLGPEGRPVLSGRERECLHWVASGRTTSQIADILCLSDDTVNEYLAHAAKKLGASNRCQAAMRAFLLSLLSL